MQYTGFFLFLITVCIGQYLNDFQMLDPNQDDKIHLEELISMFPGQDQKNPGDFITGFLKAYDLNKDKVVTLKEYNQIREQITEQRQKQQEQNAKAMKYDL